jgi:hypothetical protein
VPAGEEGEGNIKKIDHAEAGCPLLKMVSFLAAFNNKFVHLIFNCGSHGVGASTTPYAKASNEEAHTYGLPSFLWAVGGMYGEGVTVIFVGLRKSKTCSRLDFGNAFHPDHFTPFCIR